jgi:hypothetical protein
MVRANVDCVVAKGSDQLRITSGAVDGKSKTTTRAQGESSVRQSPNILLEASSQALPDVLVPFGLRSSSMS